MRRPGIIAAIAILIVLTQVTVCFASALTVVKSVPEDGATGRYPTNFAVKVYFNKDIINPAFKEANDSRFALWDEDGTRLPINVVYVPKEEGLALVIVEGTLQVDTEYTLFVSGGFVAADGSMLEQSKFITFRTRNPANDMTVSMVMMGIMFVCIIIASTIQARRKAKREAQMGRKDQKVNPYKVSKETGKSVKDIVAKTEKEKRKKAEEEAKLKERRKKAEEEWRDDDDDDDYDDYDDDDYEEYETYRVKGPRPISAGGSTYKTGRKAKAAEKARKAAAAKAAAEAAARAAGTTRPKNQKGKKKKK